MKPFSLHAVLKYRHQLEDSARRGLSQALDAEARLLEALQQAEGDLADLVARRQQDQERGTSVDWLLMFNHRIELMQQELVTRREALEKQQAQVAAKRQQLVKASKNRKIMEKLQEQQNAAYAKYLEKKELTMLDEIAVLSHERNNL